MPIKPNFAVSDTQKISQQDEAMIDNSSTQSETAALLPSCGELERSISQAIQKAYKQHLGYLPSRVSCHLFADKLSIWVEDSLTPVENVLLEKNVSGDMSSSANSFQAQTPSTSDRQVSALDGLPIQYTRDIRFAIDRAIQQRFSDVIEDHLNVDVITMVSGTCYERNCTSLTALLSSTPAVRNPERIPKTAANRQYYRKPVAKVGTAS